MNRSPQQSSTGQTLQRGPSDGVTEYKDNVSSKQTEPIFSTSGSDSDVDTSEVVPESLNWSPLLVTVC